MTTSSTVDVLVAGGGPAGLATAIIAAQSGLSVTVLEPRSGPIDKACGEGLMPGAVAALASLDVRPDGRPFTGIRYVDGPHVAEARFGRQGISNAGLGVRRTVLHDAMSARAEELAIPVRAAKVADLRQFDGYVDVDGRRARYVVAADGLHSPIRASLGLDVPVAAGRPVRYGIRRHYAAAPWSDVVEVHWTPFCEVYVTPVDDDLVGIAVLGPRGVGVDDALVALPDLRRALGDAPAVGSDRGAGPLRQRARNQVAGRVLLVGDAGGYVDALTGEGLRLAFEQARAAVDAVLDETPEEYAREWRRITAGYRRGTGLLVAATARPAVRRRLVPAAARFPGLFARCVGALGEGAQPVPRS